MLSASSEHRMRWVGVSRWPWVVYQAALSATRLFDMTNESYLCLVRVVGMRAYSERIGEHCSAPRAMVMKGLGGHHRRHCRLRERICSALSSCSHWKVVVMDGSKAGVIPRARHSRVRRPVVYQQTVVTQAMVVVLRWRGRTWAVVLVQAKRCRSFHPQRSSVYFSRQILICPTRTMASSSASQNSHRSPPSN